MAKHLALVTVLALVVFCVGLLGGLVIWLIVGHLRWRQRRHKLSRRATNTSVLAVKPHPLRHRHRNPQKPR